MSGDEVEMERNRKGSKGQVRQLKAEVWHLRASSHVAAISRASIHVRYFVPHAIDLHNKLARHVHLIAMLS